jgi:hypothetical protein
MPNYTNNSQATLLYENRQQFMWNNESVPAGTLSIAFQIRRTTGTFYPWGTSFELTFSGNPGAFEIDIMGANTDNKGNYIQLGNITSVNGSYVGRWDMPSNVWPKYVAAYVNTLTNAVNITLQVTR